jgi:hypothetical protein
MQGCSMHSHCGATTSWQVHALHIYFSYTRRANCRQPCRQHNAPRLQTTRPATTPAGTSRSRSAARACAACWPLQRRR